jgi:hypothetical protein
MIIYAPVCLTEYQFNHVNNLQLVARAHQLVQEGYKYMFDEQLVTVWSAPNYCYRCGNLASIMTVHEDGTRAFTVYDAAPENARDKAQSKRLVRKISESLEKTLISDRPISCNILFDSSVPRYDILIRTANKYINCHWFHSLVINSATLPSRIGATPEGVVDVPPRIPVRLDRITDHRGRHLVRS